MDCRTVNERLVPWLDGELAPAEARGVEEHIERCAGCGARAEALAQQGALLEGLKPTGATEQPGFWDRFDARVLPALAELPAGPAPRPAPPREFRISVAGVAAYAAALVLALGWALVQRAEVSRAQAQAAEAQSELERVRRLAVEAPLPAAPLRAGAAVPVSYAPARGQL
jgi:anti-sigma factor RsiW